MNVDVRVHFDWTYAGPVTLDATAERLVMPDCPAAPGVYRWTLTSRPGQGPVALVYIGEGGKLRRRLRNYVRPSTMRTAGKLHRIYVDHLAVGGRVTLDVAIAAQIETDGQLSDLRLDRRTARHLAEHAAIALVYLDGSAELLNADADVAQDAT